MKTSSTYNETKHTQWSAVRLDSGDYQIVSQPECGAASIATVKRIRAEYRDNARLIASAPDLLAALQAADSWLQPYPEHPNTSHDNSLCALMDQIRAAIANATGGDK